MNTGPSTVDPGGPAASSADGRFTALDWRAGPRPVAKYLPAVVSNGFAFLSGHGSLDAAGRPAIAGRLGDTVDVARGRTAAQMATLNLLTSLRSAVGSLDRVREVCRVTGYLRCAPGFTDQNEVMAGCTDLLHHVFGWAAQAHAATVYPVTECVFGLTVTVDAVFATTGPIVNPEDAR